MQHKPHHVPEQLLLGEIQVLLAEKRTYFSILRTGLAIMTVPLTVIVFLVSTESYHQLFERRGLGAATILALLAISAGGIYLLYMSGRKITRLNRLMRAVEKENDRVDKIIV